MAFALLLQAVLVPLIASPISYLLGRRFGSKSSWFAFAVIVYATIALLVSAQTNPTDESYSWFPQSLTGSLVLSSIGHFGLYLDGISIPFSIMIYVIAASVVLYSVPYMKKKIFAQKMDTSNAQETEDQETPKRKSRFGVYLAR
ncbi:MAG: hypothetical protein JRN20_17180 [Nitrososphaerota archaeon]|nr:hypothetical protein [Nitrososphaerota archaeon]